MSTLTVTESQTTQSVGQTENKEVLMMAKHTEKWTPAIGKSLKIELNKAQILYDGKLDFATLDGKGSYERWLEKIRVNESTASMYRLIHVSTFIHRDVYADVLPADYTKLYQLARIEKKLGTGKRAEKKFLDAVDYLRKPLKETRTQKFEGDSVTDRYPATKDLHEFVNEVVETPAKNKPKPEPPKADAAAAQEPERTDPVTGEAVAGMTENAAPLGDGAKENVGTAFTPEPTPGQISDTEELDFANDNEVEFAELTATFDQERLTNAIYAALREEGLSHLKVTIARKVTA